MFWYPLRGRMLFFPSLPLTCVLWVSLHSTHHANTFTPFLWGSPLTTSQLCHAEAAPTRQIIYQKDMGISLRSAACLHCCVWATVERGPVPVLSLFSVAVPWEGTGGSTVGGVARMWGSLPAPAVPLYSIHLKWVPQDLSFSRQSSTGSSPEGSLSFLKQRQMGFVIIWSTS